MTLRIETLTGAALAAALDDVARLRIEVFRAWPYLYDGDLAYEREYLQSYRDSAGAVVVGAFDEDRLVGAATGTPLADHADDFAAAFAAFAALKASFSFFFSSFFPLFKMYLLLV